MPKKETCFLFADVGRDCGSLESTWGLPCRGGGEVEFDQMDSRTSIRLNGVNVCINTSLDSETT